MFEKAARLKMRIPSLRGPLSSEDLWDLPLRELNTMAKALNKELKAQEEEDFLETENKDAGKVKLAFDLVLHVLKTKQADNKAEAEAVVRKETKQKILAILEKKRDGALEDKTEKQLLAELKKLN